MTTTTIGQRIAADIARATRRRQRQLRYQAIIKVAQAAFGTTLLLAACALMVLA